MGGNWVTVHVNTERTWRGGEHQMCYLARGLQARGHEAHIVCRPESECMRKAADMGLPVHPLMTHGDVDPLAGRRLAGLLDDLGADIVHAHAARAHLPCVFAKRMSRRRPKCLVHRRVDFSIHKLPLRISGLKYRWGVDRYIAITEAVKAIMIDDGIPAERISVVHSCTDLSRFEGVERRPGLRAELGVPPEARLIGNVGALVGHKGQKYLIDAAAQVTRECPEAFFLILGEGELRGELEAQRRALGLDQRVGMPGHRSDIAQCLAEFDVFCMSSWGEGLGTSVLEAMAMRRPVVATHAGGLAEVVRHEENALVVPPRDGAALADALQRLLRDPILAQRLAAAGRRTVEEEFTADRMVERTISVYRDVIGQPTVIPDT